MIRIILTLLVLSCGSLLASAQTAGVWEFTYLKSVAGQHERLLTFIRQNWFSMDSVATRQGLMSGYKLYDAGPDTTSQWNVIVAVAYPKKEGYEGIQEAFETIRRSHVNVLIDGKGLNQLGKIVDSRKLYERAGSSPVPTTISGNSSKRKNHH